MVQRLMSIEKRLDSDIYSPVQDMAYVLSTGYVALCILLSGFFIRIKDISIGFVKTLSWASYPKYAMIALARLELQGRKWPETDCQQSSKNIGGECNFSKDKHTGTNC